MSSDDRTDRYRPVFEPEDIFDRFVHNANEAGGGTAARDDEPTGRVDHELAEEPAWESPRRFGRAAPPSDGEVTRRAASPYADGAPPAPVLLTKVKRPSSRPPPPDPSELVPDVRSAERRADRDGPGEGREDGQIPSRELDRILTDMAVLLRYGHRGQVRDRLERLRRTYPEDLLLMRRIAEFHVENGDSEAALDVLFALASGLFERRNVHGMRQVLEQVLVLDPGNARAFKLLGLLEQR